MSVRIDKFLWAVRYFKTRNLAATACKQSQVIVNGSEAKPSRTINIGDMIKIYKGEIEREFIVHELLEKRVSAKLVDNYIEDRTPAEVYIHESIRKKRRKEDRLAKRTIGIREKGDGRPTKKQRREMQHFENYENS